MKRYLVFGYETFYPQGGMTDFQFSVDNVSDITTHGKNNGLRYFDSIEVYDSKEFVLYDYDCQTMELTKVEELEE